MIDSPGGPRIPTAGRRFVHGSPTTRRTASIIVSPPSPADRPSSIARSSYLLVTGSGGTFRSLDRGATWEQLDWQGGLGADVGFDAQYDPANPNRVYVSGAGGIFRTDNITAPVPQWVNVTSPNMGITPATDIGIFRGYTRSLLTARTCEP